MRLEINKMKYNKKKQQDEKDEHEMVKKENEDMTYRKRTRDGETRE